MQKKSLIQARPVAMVIALAGGLLGLAVIHPAASQADPCKAFTVYVDKDLHPIVPGRCEGTCFGPLHLELGTGVYLKACTD